ncbi:MAG: pyridoxamine 5'-phosphate oxidase family protein [Clostridiales bacterium]|jgi:uncharacterized pyridoxamine 5'-phosphate oxidase family protein|nr:pyridoxamine 5'-phosphate oxidase family protein [Clostridiales bacterium]
MEKTIWERVLAILNDHSVFGYMATVEGGLPRVRPMGFMFEDGGRLYFCVSTNKNVYKQLLELPYIEYSKTTADAVWVRVRGEIKFCDDIKIKERIFNEHPALKQAYQTPDNPIFKAFYMEGGEALLCSFQGWEACTF